MNKTEQETSPELQQLVMEQVTRYLEEHKTDRINDLYDMILVDVPKPPLIGVEAFESLERHMHYWNEMEKFRMSGRPCPRIGMFDKPVGNTGKKAPVIADTTDSATATSTITAFKGP